MIKGSDLLLIGGIALGIFYLNKDKNKKTEEEEEKENFSGKIDLSSDLDSEVISKIESEEIKENEEIYEFPEAIEDLSNELLLENNHRFVDGEDDSLLYGEDEFIELNNNNVFAPEENKIRKFS